MKVYPSKNAPSDRLAILRVSVCGQLPPDLSLKAIGPLRQRNIERVDQKKRIIRRAQDKPCQLLALYKLFLIDKITIKTASYPTKLLIRAFLKIIIVKIFIFENATRQSLRRIKYEHQHVAKLS